MPGCDFFGAFLLFENKAFGFDYLGSVSLIEFLFAQPHVSSFTHSRFFVGKKAMFDSDYKLGKYPWVTMISWTNL